MSILICYDDSETARRALSVARHTLGHQRATLIHVYRAPEAVLADAFSARSTDPDAGPVPQERLESMAAQRAREVLDAGRAVAAELDAEVDIQAREAASDGPIWHTILEVADELDAELIVTGARGASLETAEPLGSVSAGLLHHSRRPVLVVPAGH